MSARPAGQLSLCGKNFDVAIFFFGGNCKYDKCQTLHDVLLTELYPLIPLSVTVIVFQGHSSVRQFYLKILCSYVIKLKLCRIVR